MQPQSEIPTVQMRGIKKSFFGQEVLHGIDLEVQQGQVLGLVGHNGAGKSTLMKVLAGVHADYQGEILLEGEPVRPQSPGEARDLGIGVIHQEFALVPMFSAAENLRLGSEPRRAPGIISHKKITDESLAALEEYGFDIPLDVPVSELSVAHQQLTEIAKALLVDAKVLVMDEPTSRLAPSERDALFTMIRRLVADGVAVVYISHFLEEVLEICDTVTVLRDGKVVANRSVEDFTLESLSEQIVGEEIAENSVPIGEQASDFDPEATPVLSLQGFGPASGEGIDLDLRPGEIVGLAGLVGAGRTEILEAIVSARPSRGTMVLKGKPVSPRDVTAAVRLGVTLVPEDRKSKGLVMDRGTADNTVLSALGTRFSNGGIVNFTKRRRAYQEAVKRFRILTSDVNAPTRTLSGGNQQKVLLARSATTEPQVLLLDQPTAGVDIGAKAEIYQHVESIVQGGAVCLVASDELEELLRLSHRIAVIRNGKIADIRLASDFDEQSLLAEMSRSDA